MSRRHFMVAVDGSEWAFRAADFAIEQAKLLDAKVTFITIVPWSGYMPLTIDEIAHRPIDKTLEEETAKTNALNPIMEKHADSGVIINSELHWGDPVTELSKHIKKQKVDQVFVGRRGKSRLADIILGSVADSLAHTAVVPITLVP